MTSARFRGKLRARDTILHPNDSSVNILIVGASGNLGSLLTKHLLSSPHHLRLLTHRRTLPFDLPAGANAVVVQGDLNQPASLPRVCENVDCIVYLAGVLFQPHPERFLHRTNTIYVQNIVDAARWLMRRRLMAIWLKPTWVHLLTLVYCPIVPLFYNYDESCPTRHENSACHRILRGGTSRQENIGLTANVKKR